jgi:hypothetical protein
MRTRTAAVILIGAALVLLGVCVLTPRANPEPRFSHRPISWYVKQINSPDGTNSLDKFRAYQAAGRALQQMGPPAVAWLAQRIERKDTPWQKRYLALWKAAPAPVQRLMPQPVAAPGSPSSDLLDREVLQALAKAGPGATWVLTNYLDASVYDVNTRYQIYHVLGWSTFAEALPALERNVALANGLDRVESAFTIAQIDPRRTAEAVSILSAALTSSGARPQAADHLGDLGKAAAAAVPHLEAASSDPDPKLRERARVALQRVTGQHIPKS